MRKLILIALYLVPLVSNAQQRNTDYSFIQCALRQIDSNVLLVSREIYLPVLFLEHINQYKKELSNKIPDKNLREIIQNRNNAEMELGTDTLKKADFSDLILLTRLQVDSIQKLNLQKNGYALFSVVSIPVFDNGKTYAVISYGKGAAWKMLSGSCFLFKRKGNKWKLLGRFNGWAS